MIKLIQKHLDIKLIKLSAVLAIIYCLLFNTAILIYRFDYYKASMFKGILELSKDFLYIYIFCFIVFFGLSIHKLVLKIGSAFLFFTAAIASYYMYFFKIQPTKQVMGGLFSTDFNEIYELTSIKLIIWIIFSLFTCFYTLKTFASENKSFISRLLSAFCLVIFIYNIITPSFSILKDYFPIQYLHNTYLNFAGNFNDTNYARIDISKHYSFVDNSDEDIIGVLVIGESARYDHFSINGYERETTPNLNTLNNLISYKATSSSNLTYLSVPSLLSRYPANEIENSKYENTFLSVLTKLGFNTTWIGTQSLKRYFAGFDLSNIYNDVNFTIIPSGSALFSLNDLDGQMLPFIKELTLKANKQFLVVHTSGSHWHYNARYPNEFKNFTPICNGKAKTDASNCDKLALINSYDNSILYTDFFLSNLIDLLKNKNAFVLYVSDHGESLGENGHYGHGGFMLTEQITVPFIVWVSDDFKSKHPEKIISLKNYANTEICHDHVFHSILDCLSIESDIIDKNLSVCKSS